MSRVDQLLIANDYDRTFLDTNVAFTRFVEVCVGSGIDRAKLFAAKEQEEATAGSFDVMGHLVKQGVSEGDMAGLYKSFVASSDPKELLYPDVPEYLERLIDSGLPNLIVTYGAPAWQEAKLEAGGLADSPHLITPKKHKGELITSWKVGDHYTVVASCGQILTGNSVVLVDDKAPSFNGLPDDCSGYLLQRGGEVLESQKGSVPPQVKTVNGLSEIVFENCFSYPASSEL